MLTLFTAVSLALVAPQEISVPRPAPQLRFIDFSADLERPGVTVVVGHLGKLKEGKRERMRNGGRLGNGTAQLQISGTQYYRVPVRTTIDAPTALTGAELPEKVELAFDLQLARLPDGSERRQATTADGTQLEEDLLALWIVEKPRKGKQLELLHVIAFRPEANAGEDPERAFLDDMRDFCDVNLRLVELRSALAATETVDDGGRAKALADLRTVAEREVKLRSPTNDVLLVQHAEPLLRRVRDRIAALEKDG